MGQEQLESRPEPGFLRKQTFNDDKSSKQASLQYQQITQNRRPQQLSLLQIRHETNSNFCSQIHQITLRYQIFTQTLQKRIESFSIAGTCFTLQQLSALASTIAEFLVGYPNPHQGICTETIVFMESGAIKIFDSLLAKKVCSYRSPQRNDVKDAIQVLARATCLLQYEDQFELPILAHMIKDRYGERWLNFLLASSADYKVESMRTALRKFKQPQAALSNSLMSSFVVEDSLSQVTPCNEVEKTPFFAMPYTKVVTNRIEVTHLQKRQVQKQVIC